MRLNALLLSLLAFSFLAAACAQTTPSNTGPSTPGAAKSGDASRPHEATAAQCPALGATTAAKARKPAKLTSASLRSARDCLGGPLKLLRKAAGKRKPGALGGKTYDAKALELGEGDAGAALIQMSCTSLLPDSGDTAFYARARALESSAIAILEAAMQRKGDTLGAREEEALRTFAQQVPTCSAGDLKLYAVEAGFADVSGKAQHGIVLVDSETHEGLFFYLEASWSQ